MVTETSHGETWNRTVVRPTWTMVAVDSDEWRTYHRLPAIGRAHATACQAAGTWARDATATGARGARQLAPHDRPRFVPVSRCRPASHPHPIDLAERHPAFLGRAGGSVGVGADDLAM